jgi:coenzyme F420-0:L-glutamate ligase / coenzyme F420-1:gamma-L-glutamate ligase
MASIAARALPGLPQVRPGDDIAELILAATAESPLRGDQLLAIAHTIVSKAEGALVELASVTPSPQARELAAGQDKDPRLVQVVLDESEELLRAERGVLIARTRQGLVCANAGVDQSNSTDADTVVLLPRDPDASARAIRARLAALGGQKRAPAVLITDSFGRAWRHGQTDVAIGLAGMAALDDWRGRTDAHGLALRATWLAIADAAAGLADLARAKDSGEPVVVIDGLGPHLTVEDGPGAAALIRPLEEDMFA